MIAATWGEGEPPARAARAYAELMGDAAPRLDGVEFGVLALGDTAYVEFCAIGKAIDERLEALGGKRVADRVDCDLDFAAPAAAWIDDARQGAGAAGADARHRRSRSISAPSRRQRRARPGRGRDHRAHQPQLVALRQGDDPSRARLRRRGAGLQAGRLARPLSRERSGLCRRAAQGRRASRPTTRCAATSSRTATSPRCRSRRWRTTPPRPAISTSRRCSTPARPETWIAGRQLIDLIEHFPIALTAEQLRALTRPLAPRAYSIASSRREVGDEAHLLISAVRYETPRPRAQGRRLELRRRPPEEGRPRARQAASRTSISRLPAADRDIIMVGPGTGVAPFRAFVQERRASGRHRPLLAVLRRPQLHPRLPLPARMAGRAQGRRADAHGRRVLARHAGEGLRAAPHLGAPPRPRRLARQRRVSSTSAATPRRWRRTCARRWCAPMRT